MSKNFVAALVATALLSFAPSARAFPTHASLQPKRAFLATEPFQLSVPLDAPPEPLAPPSGRVQWKRLGTATAALVGAQTGVVALMTQLPMNVTGWTGRAPQFSNIKRSFQYGPRIDQDKWYWNWAAHPYDGSLYFLIARNRGANFAESFAYAAAISTYWEFVPEAVYERASIQDLIVTPVAGAVLGEAMFRYKRFLVRRHREHPTKLKKVLMVLIDPVDALSGAI